MGKLNKYLRNKKKSGSFVQPTAGQMQKWFEDNGIEYRSYPEQFRVCNPDGDTEFSMSVSKDHALVHDFRVSHTQYDGTFVYFVSLYKNINIREAINEVCGNNVNRKKIEKDDEVEEPEKLVELPDGCIPLRNENKDKLWKMNMSYLMNERGLEKEVIYRANIHYLGTQVVVPYYEFGMLVYYQLRYQIDKRFSFPPSNVTSKTAGDFLYGFDDVEPCSKVIQVESIFNALSIGPGAVATGGASLKDGQIKLLLSLSPDCVVLAPDNDGAGIKSAIKDYLSLRKKVDDIYYCLPPYNKNRDSQEDWNDLKRMDVDVGLYINKKMKKMTMKSVFDGIDGKLFNWEGFK